MPAELALDRHYPGIGVLIGELNDLLAEGSESADAFATLAGLDAQIVFAAARLSDGAGKMRGTGCPWRRESR